MAAINKSVAKKIIASFLLAAMTFSLLPKIIGNDSILAAPVENNQETTETANTAVTKKSKPLTTHEPQTYIFDYNQNIGSRLTTESGKSLVGSGTCPEWDWLPILLPGDKVKIIPKLPSEEEAIKNNGVSVGEGGLVLKNMTAKSIEPSFKVTKAVAYGSVDEIDKDKHDNRFIQEFEITGTEPVAIVVHGGTSGYTNLKKSVWINNTEVKITLSYGADWLEFQRFPEYINLNYQLFDGDNTGEEKKLMDDKFEVTYYGETENPDAIWAVDAINNLYAKDEEKVTFKINKPYAEGYEIAFNDIYVIRKGYNFPLTEYDDYTGTITVTPRWGATSRTISGQNFELYGSYSEDWTNVAYYCYKARTLTLDACGGTINGFASRIYEMGIYSSSYKALAKDEADGKYIPVRDGYIFDGWYTDKDYTNKVESIKSFVDEHDFNSEDPEELICRLYAKWIKIGWVKDGGKWFYNDSNGVKQTGWVKDAGIWYFMDSKGVMQTGWAQVAGKWYYLNSDGSMATGWLKIGDKWYYLNSSGDMATGWLDWNGQWYYMTPVAGNMATGWKQISGKWYYLKSSGVMASKEYVQGYWLNENGTWTYQYKASWKHDSKGWWYGDNSGWYAKNGSFTIDGKLYDFDASGYCTNP